MSNSEEITEAPFTNATPSSIEETVETETHQKEEDVTDQLVFMVQSLTGSQRRRTMQKLKPILASTLLNGISDESFTESCSDGNDAQKSSPQAVNTMMTNNGEITLSSGTSKIHITTGNASHTFVSKLRAFSGVTPTPCAQVDFRTWYKATKRLMNDKTVSDS